MSWIGTGIAIVSTVASGIGTYMSVQGQRAAADQAESTAKYNAEIQRNQAMQENAAAAENSRRKARENARVIARQRAIIAQSGLAMEGTPLAVLGETASMLQRDLMDMGYEAKNKVNALQAGANMSLWQGKNQAGALRTEGLTTGITGVGSMATGYLNATGKIAPKQTTP